MRKRQLLILAATALLTAQPAHAQFGKLKGLANKAKEKVTQTAKDKGTDGTVVDAVTQAARDEAPWPMASDAPKYNGKDFYEFLMNAGDESDEYVTSLHDQMFARFRQNAAIERAGGDGASAANQENRRFVAFFKEMTKSLNIWTRNAVNSRGELTPSTAYYWFFPRKEKEFNTTWTVMPQEGGGYRFRTNHDESTFLNADELAEAQYSVQRMRKWQLLSKGAYELVEECGYGKMEHLKNIYALSGMYAGAVGEACKANKPENLERKPRPAAGSMHAQMKAKALAVAKAEDPEVVDVIITSAQWDVKMKGLVPVCRNIYGFYVYKDDLGLQCYPRMWTEDYQGNNRYGSLRKGGVGAGSTFYIK